MIASRITSRVPRLLRSRHFASIALATCVATAAVSCGSGGSGGGSASSLQTPASVLATFGDGEIMLSWSDVPGAGTYNVYWSTAPGVDSDSGTQISAAASPFMHTGLTNGQPYYYVVTATDGAIESKASLQVSSIPRAVTPNAFAPPWVSAQVTSTKTYLYDSGKTERQNAMSLLAIIKNLTPGEKLVVDGGTYRFTDPPFVFNIQGTSTAPIRIVAADNETPVFVRSDDAYSGLEIGGKGAEPASEYVLVRGFEISDGAFGIRLHKTRNVWIDGCHVHDIGGAGITVNTEDADSVYLTANHIHHTASYGEGVFLGQNGGSVVVSNSVIADNHIHDTLGALQGEGIDLKHGSYGNWIVANVIHATKYPCIKFEGTGGKAVNVFERNLCYDSGDNIIQAEAGEAIVRNNLLVGPAGNKAFDSSHNEATLKNLTVVHNTIVNEQGYGAGLFAWNGQQGLVFANNAVYCRQATANSYSLSLKQGYAGGQISGNVVFGQVKFLASGYTVGSGLADFANLSTWFGSFTGHLSDYVPDNMGSLVGNGNATYAEMDDYTGAIRTGPLTVGCLDAPN